MEVMGILRKYRLLRIALLLGCGIVIGFTLRVTSRESAQVAGGNVERLPEKQIQGTGEPVRNQAVFPSGTIEEQFAAALKHSDEMQQKQAARAVFAKLGLEKPKPIAARVEKFTADFSESDGGNGGWILCSEFYRRWGELSPAEALEFLKDHESYWAGQTDAIWTAWARTAPNAAVAAYDPKLEGQHSREIQEAILDGLCSVDPGKALRFADAQEMGGEYDFDPKNRGEQYARYLACWELLEYVPVERPDDTFGLAMYSWFYRDPESALEAMLTLGHETYQRAALGFLFSNWLMFDPESALLALNRITDRGLRESTTHTAMQAYLLRHPREAFERVIKLPKYVAYRYKRNPSEDIDPFEETDPTVDNEIIEIDEEDGEQPIPFRYCDTTPTSSHRRMYLISEAAASLGFSEGKAAWDRATKIEDKGKRAAAMGGALAGWLLKDPEAVRRFTAEGIASHSFEEPGGSDFPDYAARLVAKKLAQHDFLQAIAWVEALPDGSLREAGIETAAKTRLDLAWDLALKEASPNGGVDPKVFQDVQKREYAPVMEWLASLPPSKGRDEAIYWLVFRLEDLDDPSSALKWAVSNGDTRLRGLIFESLAWKVFPKKNDNAEVDFDFDAWSAAHPELSAELKQELARKKKNNNGGADEK